MRNLSNIFPLIFLSLIIFISCGKVSSLSGIHGKWNIVYDSAYKGVAMGNHVETYTGQTGDYFDFRSDNNLYIKEGTFLDTLTYLVISDSRLLITSFESSDNGASDTVYVKNLSANEATLQTKYFATPGGIFYRAVGLKR